MNPFRLRRSVAAGLLLLTGSAASAGDWECLHKLCGHKSCTQSTRVTLPAREVVVETEQPRIQVREISAAREVASRAVRRSVDTVPIGTVYMPLALPTIGFGAVGFGGVATAGVETGGTREVVREVDGLSQIEAANRAEREAVRRRAAIHEEMQLSMDNHSRAIQRIGATRAVTSSGCDSADIDKKLNALSAKIDTLSDRVKSVETLLIYHDNYIKAQAGSSSGSSGSSGSSQSSGGGVTADTTTRPNTTQSAPPLMSAPVPPK